MSVPFPCLAGIVQPCRWPDCECQIKAGLNVAPQSPKTSDGTERNESPADAALAECAMETPRTDAEMVECGKRCHGPLAMYGYMTEFAKDLERELAAAKQRIDTMLRVDCEQANILLQAMGGDPGYSLLDNAKRLRVCGRPAVAAPSLTVASWEESNRFYLEALEESVKLQSHYAELLNMHDGGQRMTFTVDSWLKRLEEISSSSQETKHESR